MNNVFHNTDNHLDISACRQLQRMLDRMGLASAMLNAAGDIILPVLASAAEKRTGCLNERDCFSGAVEHVQGHSLREPFYTARCAHGNQLLVIPLRQQRHPAGLFLCCLNSSRQQESCFSAELKIPDVLAPADENALGTGHPHNDENLTAVFSTLVKEVMDKSRRCLEISDELEKMTESLSKSYEEVALLQRISEGMKLTHKPRDFFSQLCPDIREVIEVEHFLILWRDNHDVAGTGPDIAPVHTPLSPRLLELIWTRAGNHASGYDHILIDGDTDRPFNFDWPEPIRNIVCVPISRNQRHFGVVVAINTQTKPDFDSIDTRLLISVSHEIAVFLENFYLYHDLHDLFLGSLRALSSSIDAKDPYTFGHSERVALIARHIAEQLKLDPIQINNIYLAGLLHDVGKIGIDEAILRKPGRLTDDEYTQIKRHSQIGADILKPIKKMEQVAHTILCHHERYDGNGYPNRLAARDIPLAGRIIMIADSFDVMIADRTYSKALPVPAALAEIRRFAGTQFDPDLAAVFLASDISSLIDKLNAISHHSDDQIQSPTPLPLCDFPAIL